MTNANTESTEIAANVSFANCSTAMIARSIYAGHVWVIQHFTGAAKLE